MSNSGKILNTQPVVSPVGLYGPLAEHINNIAGEQRVLLGEGGHEFLNRVNWARAHLSEAGLIKDDGLSLSEEGKRVVSLPLSEINEDFLIQYQNFREFRREESRRNITDSEVIEDIDDIERRINAIRVGSVKEWIEILKNEMEEKAESHIVPLLRHYLTYPNFECGMISVENALEIKDLNLKIAAFGNRVIEQTGIPRHFREAGEQNERRYNIPFKGRDYGGKYLWRLRPELVDALIILDEGIQKHAKKPSVDLDAEAKIVKIELRKHTPERGSDRPPTKIDYEQLYRKQRNIGNDGERFVFLSEKNKLKEWGRNDLSERVEWVSEKYGDGLGYDISSFDKNGNEIFIEVKTTSESGGRLQFYMSDNEVEKYFENEKIDIYFVSDIYNEPVIGIVNREEFTRDLLTPTQYRVDVDISEYNRME